MLRRSTFRRIRHSFPSPVFLSASKCIFSAATTDIEAPRSPSTSSLLLPQSSPHHNSLTTFLAHARQTSLSPTSTTYIGTYYEYLCLTSLRRLGFSLHRTGGRSDHGIDLLGHWHLPSLPHPLHVFVQCKALRAKAGPNLVRELEGAFNGAPQGWKGEQVVGVLCATREATKGVREAVRHSRRPVVWIMLQDVGNGQGRVRQVLWNQRVAAVGAEGVGVQLRHWMGEDGQGMDCEMALMWEGKVWEPEVKEEGG